MCKSEELEKAYKIQRNDCVYLLRIAENSFFANINIKKVFDSRNFWKMVKPSFSEKLVHKEIINLIKNEKTLTNNKDIADKIYFCSH